MHSTLRLFILPVPRVRRRRPALLSTLALWRHRSRSRQQLASLDDRELDDIGLSRAERWCECRKWFWEP